MQDKINDFIFIIYYIYIMVLFYYMVLDVQAKLKSLLRLS